MNCITTDKGLEERLQWTRVIQSNFWSKTFCLALPRDEYGVVVPTDFTAPCPRVRHCILSWGLHVRNVYQSFRYWRRRRCGQTTQYHHWELCCAGQTAALDTCPLSIRSAARRTKEPSIMTWYWIQLLANLKRFVCVEQLGRVTLLFHRISDDI